MSSLPPNSLGQDAQSIFAAGVAAVLGDPLIADAVRFDDFAMLIGDEAIANDSFDRIIVVGAGKATAAMAAGLSRVIRNESNLGPDFPLVGHVNVPDGCHRDLPGITVLEARPAGVNEPTPSAIAGTDRILQLVQDAGPRDLVIGLISGGGSALLCRPSPGLTLDDKLAVTRWLSSHGADIIAINTVRKHLSDVKGGGLLRACRAGRLITLVLSDVLGDPLDLIASGPTVIDPSSPRDALAILDQFDPENRLPSAVRDHLRGMGDSTRSSKVCLHQTIVVGNNAVAVDAAGVVAESLGYNHVMHCHPKPEGDAEWVGRQLADQVDAMLRAAHSSHHQVNHRQETHRQDAFISGGEPTVNLAEESLRGWGGRNGQVVLSAYARLLEMNLDDQAWSRLAILSGGTDGEDGPSEAAGGMIDGTIHQRIVDSGLDVHDALRRNDSHTFLQTCGGLLITGPTGTNVCDLRVALVDHPSHRRHGT